MRVAVLGCGSIGVRHARNLLALGVSELLLYDPDPQSRERAEMKLGHGALGDLEEIWSRRPDAVVVATPSALHVPVALHAAGLGCHLFIEKPLSHRLEGVAPLEEIARERGLVTMVACNMRFHPGPETVKRLLESGRVGSPVAARIYAGSYLPTWRPSQNYRDSYSASTESGGAVLDVIHEIDLALWYLGPARLVGAATLPAHVIGLETDGLAEILLRHDSGALSSLHLCDFIQRDYHRGCQIIGSEGTLYWGFGGAVDVYGPDGQLSETHPQPEGWDLNQMYLDELKHFLHCVETGEDTANPIRSGAAILAIALASRDWRGEA